MSTSRPGPPPPQLSVSEALYNHLVLPPWLPHRQDSNIQEIETELIDRLIESTQHMRDLPANVYAPTWTSIHRSLQATKTINAGGRINRLTLTRELLGLDDTGFLAVHVCAQNCALFIRRTIDSVFGPSVIFEAFEASAKNEDILATENALQWDFPGAAVAVPYSTFLEDGFISNLTIFLENACRESVKDFAAHAFKAGTQIFEYRNTAEPGLISSMLMAILQENGRRIAPKPLQKMVRDDVCWNNADKPWRRLPFWLILRVSIARFLAIKLGGEIGRADYKFCLVHLLSNFLSEIQGSATSVERLDFLKKKICRRLTKLEVDKERSQDEDVAVRIDYLFLRLESRIKGAVSQASAFINASWSQQKLFMAKTVPPLPRRAAPDDLRLDLRASGELLTSILTGYSRPRKFGDDRFNSVSIAEAAKRHLSSFAQLHFNLVDMETRCHDFLTASALSQQGDKICTSASQLISEHIRSVFFLPDFATDVKSGLILNIMELWVKMDQAACNLYPLLKEYHPMIYPEMLDVLLIPDQQDMERLLHVQLYLEDRISTCGRSKVSIFDDPNVRGCFGHRAYEEFPDSRNFKSLHESIESWAQTQRQAKKREWKEKMSEYSFLSKQVEQSSCVYIMDEDKPLVRGFHHPQCHRCRMLNDLDHMRIQVYEHPLPSDHVVAKAVIFELACPAIFALYRDTSWKIISKLSFPALEESMKPRCSIREYEQLQRFRNDTTSSFSLASTTKSFLITHYSRLSFPVEWESERDGVCRPNGLKLSFFDTQSSIWPGRRRYRQSFAHHVKLDMPQSSPFFKLLQEPAFADNIYGCSSYEVMATVSTCPPGINVHEYLAFQTVASGKSRRWLAILTELASANLNFSNEATTMLVRHLIHQCGPLGESKDSFRLIHEIFRDETFCERLIQQLSHRLESLSANWRETSLMEIIISIALRIFDLAAAANHPEATGQAASLLSRARQICVHWFTLLRVETYQTEDSMTAQRYQQYALWAALLCKQTFGGYVSYALEMGDGLLAIFIQSSIVAQENLVAKVDTLPSLLQHAIIRDLRMSYNIRDTISRGILSRPAVFAEALEEIWPKDEGCNRTLSDLVPRHGFWLSCVVTTGEDCQQNVFYNFVEGIFLVDGHPIGKLPKDPTKSLILNELFGNRTLLTRPSYRNGMQYQLCLRPQNYSIHVGFDKNKEMVIRAFRSKNSLQLIDRERFRSSEPWDLPGPLLDDCFHWLDLNTHQVYITKKQYPWPGDKFSGFILSIRDRTCARTRYHNGQRFSDSVVNTSSPLFNRAARILDSLEPKRYILVLQPGGRRYVQVEMPRLNILFHVNDSLLLQSPQLRCEIDPNQDIGTWYGLRSKLVCRNVNNTMHRSILVPLGKLLVEAQGCHVSLRVESHGSYAKFTVNSVLGKIDCAAEPVLVYTKALIHAFTSFVIPDPLTNRTGREEAAHWLQSGICQPWEPLGYTALEILTGIAQLTPKRVYYPENLRVMRTDHWNADIPMTLQHSVFRPLVDRIIEGSRVLTKFALTDRTAPELLDIGDSHLHKRARLRHQALERCPEDSLSQNPPENRAYQSRDRPSSTNIRHRNALEIVNLIKRWPQNFVTTAKLAQDLAVGKIIGGYGNVYDRASLNDRLNVDIISAWGSLVRFAQQANDRYSLMFLFGLVSFRLDVDMSLMRTIVAFAVFEELRSIELPPWEEYIHFQVNQVPQLTYLLHLLKPFGASQPTDDRTILEDFASAKQQKKLRMVRLKHEARVEEDSKFFATFLLRQWPCVEPGASQLSQSVLVETGPALDVIRPEWKRLYQNMDLTKHFENIQAILNQRSSEEQFDPTQVIHNEDVFPTRMRGGELIDLGRLLTKSMHVQPFPEVERKENMSTPLMAKQTSHGFSFGTNMSHPFSTPNGHFSYKNNAPRSVQPLSNHFDTRGIRINHENIQAAAKLGEMTKSLQASRSGVRLRYAVDLQHSLDAFQKFDSSKAMKSSMLSTRDFSIKSSGDKIDQTLARLQASLSSPSPDCSSRRIEWLKAGDLWPDTSKAALLRQLRSTATRRTFGSGIHKALVQLGVEITRLQREIRLHDLALNKDAGRYQEEEANEGHSNWDPSERSDWLLLEVESNMMIRPVQIDVALATMAPKSGSNSVLQMNMGQGKTSCIIPMVAAALADTKKLVRVVVPKALLQQTAQLLQYRLGGILDRQLRHVPFYRRTPTTDENIRAFHSLHEEMLKSAGIMICQPEHNMSFALSGRQRLLDNQIAQAGPMIKLQSWLTRVSRDILDESDYTLAVRTQLIYPSGSQMTVDGHPHRWQVVEAVLRLVDGLMYSLPASFPHSLGVIRRPGGGFPLIFFLRHDVEEELVRRLTRDVCQGLGGILPMNTNALSTGERVAIKDFLSSTSPSPKSIEGIRKMCPDRPSVRQTVYLLRGLLVNRILMMTLKKRWNVEYGLHPQRDPIAVPFYAKGVPSDQSEWGHPDVAILFTCLAFYYDGINLAQLRQCLEHVLKSDDPAAEYDKWAQSSDDFPSSLRAWNSINVDDDMQLNEIWKAVRYARVVIDYFLNNFVFPRHAKQFKVKLQSNGWDIPLFQLNDNSDRSKKSVAQPMTTGFSGTNDNRTMLPLNIEQQDLPSLLHTSAEVLTYLLHSRNRPCVLFSQLRDSRFGRATEMDLLYGLRKMSIRVLIDAGAQILEMDNLTLVQEWLKIEGRALAALYFDQANKPWVLTRQDKRTPLVASPFADDLSQCLVYLDEAHTRGTDLKLPPSSRGALTLRLGQTKDHTVQAAMRLRQLGSTQTVTFFIPPEVHQSIADLQNKTMREFIDSADVIEWLLDNTCEAIEQLQPLYYSQGVDFCRRMQAELDNPKFLINKSHREAFIQKIKQDEQQTLQQLYEPKYKNRAPQDSKPSNEKLKGFIKELNSRRKTFQDTGRAVHASALQEVEQEREVAFEVESVRQVKKPQQYAAYAFPGLHPDLEGFARTGRMPADAHYFSHILYSMSRTGLGRKFKIRRGVSDSKLFVTSEFDRTVRLNSDLTMDNFMRPVNWILWSQATETAIIIIPEEAEALITIIRGRKFQMASHLLCYATPITRKMLHFNDLNFYSIPSLPPHWKAPVWLRTELGIFSGRLYFSWDEYEHVCQFLGIEEGVLEEDELGALTNLDGAAEHDDQDTSKADLPKQAGKRFVDKPMTFIQEWLAVRRRGQDFVHSPMGFVSQGRILQHDHVFFAQPLEELAGNGDIVIASILQPRNNEGQDHHDDYHGVDDMGANEGVEGDIGDDRFVYDDTDFGDHTGQGFGSDSG